ncbi:MAG: indolepyruvate oxidoreductase subunit beta [Tissierellia bacterium]|nr:indolepyruvate oxidoreductase subunit beta [Tissierellia bacterium]
MKTKNIMIVGVGGQGTLLTSRVLGGVILEAGYDVKISEVHGMAQRGGSVVTFVRYGDQVAEPIVEEGCADILIAFEKLEAQRYAHFLAEDGVLIVNDQRIDPMPVVIGKEEYPEDVLEKLGEKFQVICLDALSEARALGNVKVFNTVVLGVTAQHMEIEKDIWEKVIRSTVPPKTIDVNLAAFEVGFHTKKVTNL